MRQNHNTRMLQVEVTSARLAPVRVVLSTSQSSILNWDWSTESSGQFDGLVPLWQALDSEIASPIQQSLWSESCCATLPLDGKRHFVVVKTGSQSGAIAPLVRSKGVLGRLEHLGVKILREPTDLVFSDPLALKSLAHALVQLGSPLFLDRIPANSPTVAAIQEAYRGRGLVRLHAAQPYPRILLHQGWRQPESQLNSGRRSDLRRAVRNAEKIGTLTFQILSPTPSQLGQFLKRLWKSRLRTGKVAKGAPSPMTSCEVSSTATMLLQQARREFCGYASCEWAAKLLRCS